MRQDAPPTPLGQSPTAAGQAPIGMGQSPTAAGQAPIGMGQSPTAVGQSPTGMGPPEREELVEYLESDQLVRQREQPVSRAQLTGRAAAGLWSLRVFAIVLAAMVIYTFVAQLGSPG